MFTACVLFVYHIIANLYNIDISVTNINISNIKKTHLHKYVICYVVMCLNKTSLEIETSAQFVISL